MVAFSGCLSLPFSSSPSLLHPSAYSPLPYVSPSNLSFCLQPQVPAAVSLASLPQPWPREEEGECPTPNHPPVFSPPVIKDKDHHIL